MPRVRPFDLPVLETFTPDTAIVADNGAMVGRVDPTQIVNFAVPVASQEEAEAGAVNDRMMTPLRVAQYLNNGVVTVDSLTDDPDHLRSITEKLLFRQDGAGSLDRPVMDKLRGVISLKDKDIEADGAPTAFLNAITTAAGAPVHIPGGTYEWDREVAYTGDVRLIIDGPVTIVCTAQQTINSLMKITGRLQILGGSPLTLDGQRKSYLLLHCPTWLPQLENVHFKRSLSVAGLYGRNFGGANAADFSGSNGLGHGFMRNCTGEGVGSLCLPTGSGIDTDTSFGLINCRTDITSGDVTNLFGLYDMRYGYVWGGYYQGVSGTSPNIYRTARCEYIGGTYDGLMRGPTVGNSAREVTIDGSVAKNTTFSGASIDARLSDGTVPFVVGRVNLTVIGSPQHGVFCQASGIEINVVQDFGPGATNTLSTVRLTDALAVRLGTITARNADDAVLVRLGSGASPTPGSSAIRTGEWRTDSLNAVPVSLTTGQSYLDFSPVRFVTSNAVLTMLDDIIIVDAKTGPVDLDLPSATYAQHVRGKRWKIIVRDSTNAVTITRAGGGSTAINGTSQYTIPAGNPYVHVEAISLGQGSYAVVPSFTPTGQ